MRIFGIILIIANLWWVNFTYVTGLQKLEQSYSTYTIGRNDLIFKIHIMSEALLALYLDRSYNL